MTRKDFLKGIIQIRTNVMHWETDNKYKDLCFELDSVFDYSHPLYELFQDLFEPRKIDRGIDDLNGYWLGYNTLENNINRLIVLDMFKETVLSFKMYKEF